MQEKDIIWIKNSRDEILPDNSQNLDSISKLLDSTGPGFCLAKFTQGTLHLSNGTVHACHHPAPHQIPLSELEQNNTALFNTTTLQRARQEMLNGVKPDECDYCWRVESNSSVSDRHMKSIEPWAFGEYQRTVKLRGNEHIAPTYLEVDFSNVCNFKCSYCGPEFSTTWAEDLKRNGPIILLDGTEQVRWAQGWQDLGNLVYKNSEDNPYTAAFWQWFPTIYKNLKVFRITGGEPLLSKHTYTVLDMLIAEPNQHLDFAVNTNLCAPQKLWDEFVAKITKIAHTNCARSMTVYASLDGWGARAEYARTGLDFELFKSRYEQLLEIGNIRAVIMCAYNIFSVTSVVNLFEWHVQMRQKYNPDHSIVKLENDTGFRITSGLTSQQRIDRNRSHATVVDLDTPYLRHPEYLDAKIITDELAQDYMIPSINYMSRNVYLNIWNLDQGFSLQQLEKFKRIVINRLRLYSKNKLDGSDPVVNKHRAMFYDFVNEQDRRNNTNFLQVFPEMSEFYSVCKSEREKL